MGTYTWQANSNNGFGGNNVIGTEILLGEYNGSISATSPSNGLVNAYDSFMYNENYGFDSHWAFSLKGETSNNYDRFPYYSETTFFRFLNSA